MSKKNIILLSKEYRTKTVIENFTEKQQGLIKVKDLIPLWESQTWLSWKDKYNNRIEDFNKHFSEYIDGIDIENNDDIYILNTKRDNLWGKTLWFCFISKKLDKKLSEGINSNYKYQNQMRQDLKDREHHDKLQEYIKKYRLTKDSYIENMTNEEVDKFCEACDSFSEMASIPGFILHNVLEWK